MSLPGRRLSCPIFSSRVIFDISSSINSFIGFFWANTDVAASIATTNIDIFFILIGFMCAKVHIKSEKTKDYNDFLIILFHFKCHLCLYITCRCSNKSLETPGFHHPFTLTIVIKTEHRLVDSESDVTRLTRGKSNLLESL